MRKAFKEFTIKHGGVILPFASLSKPYQLAIAWYMAIDGEAWDVLCDIKYDDDPHQKHNKKRLTKAISEYVKEYGKVKFGVISLPINLCKQMIMTEKYVKKDYENFEDYHKWYQSNDNEKHTKRNPWPCILSDDFGCEFFQDGWHRFHRYVDLKMKNIPCVYYV